MVRKQSAIHRRIIVSNKEDILSYFTGNGVAAEQEQDAIYDIEIY